MKRLFLISFWFVLTLFYACDDVKNDSALSNPQSIEINIHEVIPNPKAFKILEQAEENSKKKNLENSGGNVNLLDKKYYPITSRLKKYYPASFVKRDTIFVREYARWAYCAYGQNLKENDLKSMDSLFNNTDAMKDLYNWTFIPVSSDIYYFILMPRQDYVKLNKEHVSEILTKKINEDRTDVIIKLKPQALEDLKNFFKSNRILIAYIFINNEMYLSEDINSSTIDRGIIIKDYNETIHSRITPVWKPKKAD